MTETSRGPDGTRVLYGFLTCLAIDVVVFLGMTTLFRSGDKLGMVILVFIFPFVQVLWVLPLIVYHFWKHHANFAKGVLLAAALKLLLLGSYCGMMALKK